MAAQVFCFLTVTHVYFATGCDWRGYVAYLLIAVAISIQHMRYIKREFAEAIKNLDESLEALKEARK